MYTENGARCSQLGIRTSGVLLHCRNNSVSVLRFFHKSIKTSDKPAQYIVLEKTKINCG